jgi:hypothetical protein
MKYDGYLAGLFSGLEQVVQLLLLVDGPGLPCGKGPFGFRLSAGVLLRREKRHFFKICNSPRP